MSFQNYTLDNDKKAPKQGMFFTQHNVFFLNLFSRFIYDFPKSYS